MSANSSLSLDKQIIFFPRGHLYHHPPPPALGRADPVLTGRAKGAIPLNILTYRW